jgi:4-amino-4-deoxy-L-arabinose transferase-like glycosyltransferase
MPILRRLCDYCDNGRRALWILLAVLALSFAGKVILRLVVLRDPDYWQSGYSFYFQMAENYLRTGYVCLGDPESGEGAYYAFRPPLYPVLIAAACRLTHYSVDAFVVCEALISTATAALVYWITAQFARPAAALAAATLDAFCPYDFYHDTQLQENVLYDALALAACACLMVALDQRTWRGFFLAGVLAGVAVLTRMSHMAATLFLLGTVLFPFRHRARQAFHSVLAFSLGLLILLGPWMVRNWLVTRHLALTSETGFALARAHNAYTFRYYPYRANIDESWEAYHQNMDEQHRKALDRVADDEFACQRWYYQQAVEYIRAHPLETVLEGFYKVAVNFLGVLSPLHGWFKNWSYTISYWLVTLLALRGLPRLRGTSFFKVFLAMVLAQAAVSFVFWAHTSHRTYLDPLFAVAAGVGVVAVVPLRPVRRDGDEGLAPVQNIRGPEDFHR